jgi:hypothetical protein
VRPAPVRAAGPAPRGRVTAAPARLRPPSPRRFVFFHQLFVLYLLYYCICQPIWPRPVLRKNSILIALDRESPSSDNSRGTPHTSEGYLGYDTIHTSTSPPYTTCWHAADTSGQCLTLCRFLSALARDARSRKPLPAQAARPLPRTRRQAAAGHPCDPHRPDRARPLVRLARSLGHRPATDLDLVASPEVPRVLAVDIPSWMTTDPNGPASADPSYGP